MRGRKEAAAVAMCFLLRTHEARTEGLTGRNGWQVLLVTLLGCLASASRRLSGSGCPVVGHLGLGSLVVVVGRRSEEARRVGDRVLPQIARRETALAAVSSCVRLEERSSKNGVLFFPSLAPRVRRQGLWKDECEASDKRERRDAPKGGDEERGQVSSVQF